MKKGSGITSERWLDSFASWILRDPVSGCWNWPFSRDEDGYARQYLDGKTKRLARVVLARKLGRAIHPGCLALHTCDNPACLNEDHLYEGDNSSNMRDRSRRNRHPIGSKAARAKLSEVEILAIKSFFARGKSVKEIVDLFPVSRAQLYRIRGGEHWAHLK